MPSTPRAAVAALIALGVVVWVAPPTGRSRRMSQREWERRASALLADARAGSASVEDARPSATTTPGTSVDAGSANTQSSTANVKEIPRADMPRGLRLVLIGDSLMRYQYLSLAYFLHHGRWWDPAVRDRQIVNEKTFDNWPEFYAATNRLLHPKEHCDCFRSGDINKTTENRYYWDAELDNYVVYHQIFSADTEFHGTLNPREAWDGIFAGGAPPAYQHVERPRAWAVREWADFVRDILSQYKPRPTHVVMNAGMWATVFGEKPEAGRALIAALKQLGVEYYWRGTTVTRRGLQTTNDVTATMSELVGADRTISALWTMQVRREFYWDDVHFWEPLYRVMNEDLLEVALGYRFPTSYDFVDRRQYFVDYVPESAVHAALRRVYNSDTEDCVLAAADRPRGLRLTMIGDADMRGQYMSLVHFLRHGRWWDPRRQDGYFFVTAGNAGAAIPRYPQRLYERVHEALYPNEYVDAWWSPDTANSSDNRYFITRDDGGAVDSIVSYHLKYGGLLGFKGRHTPSALRDRFADAPKLGEVYGEGYTPTWSYADYHDFLEHHVLRVEPRPTHVVLSMGWWNAFRDDAGSLLEKMMDTVRRAGAKVVWRTITFQRNHAVTVYNVDDLGCKWADVCVDNKWTHAVDSRLYRAEWDVAEPVYRAMNERLLGALGYEFPAGYRPVDVTHELAERREGVTEGVPQETETT